MHRQFWLASIIAASLCTAVPLSQAAESSQGDSQTAKQEAKEKKLKLAKHETAIYVTDMHCRSCARKIARKVFALKGVKDVRHDVKANLSIVVSQPKQPLDPLKAWAAVQSAGFKPTKLIGPAGTYVPHQDKDKKQPVKLAEKPKPKDDTATQ